MTRTQAFARLVLLGLLTGCLEQTLVVSDQQVTDHGEERTDARQDEPDDDAGSGPNDAGGDEGSQQRSCERCGNFDTRRCAPFRPERQWGGFCVECGCCFDDRDCASRGPEWVCAWPFGGEGTQPGRCVHPDWLLPP